MRVTGRTCPAARGCRPTRNLFCDREPGMVVHLGDVSVKERGALQVGPLEVAVAAKTLTLKATHPSRHPPRVPPPVPRMFATNPNMPPTCTGAREETPPSEANPHPLPRPTQSSSDASPHSLHSGWGHQRRMPTQTATIRSKPKPTPQAAAVARNPVWRCKLSPAYMRVPPYTSSSTRTNCTMASHAGECARMLRAMAISDKAMNTLSESRTKP